MPLRILIVPDKFKGSLTAHAAASAIAAGWRKARPADLIDLLPMSDGGDGFGPVLSGFIGAKPHPVRTVDAARRPLRARWWSHSPDKTAIIDSAAIIGLALLPARKFHPFQLDSFGLGKVMLAAAQSGAGNAVIGLGGSATNDGGFGLAQALDWKFFDRNWDELREWWQLAGLAHVRPPACPLSWKVTAAVDVGNPLLGAKGCSRIYGPQKGLRPQNFVLAEKCLRRLAVVMHKHSGIDRAKMPGAGAAGGLGFGLLAFAGAKLKPGFDIFAEYARLDDRIRQADLVITGEGHIDHQTYMGKGVGQIAVRCRKARVPCLALAGLILQPARANALFTQTRSLLEIADAADAQVSAGRHLRELARRAAQAFKIPTTKISR
jgi:glycerate kinase